MVRDRSPRTLHRDLARLREEEAAVFQTRAHFLFVQGGFENVLPRDVGVGKPYRGADRAKVRGNHDAFPGAGMPKFYNECEESKGDDAEHESVNGERAVRLSVKCSGTLDTLRGTYLRSTRLQNAATRIETGCWLSTK